MGQVHLEDCFRHLESEEPSIAWSCEQCHENEASKRLWVATYPRILIVHLERFGYAPSTGRRYKRADPIVVPVTFVRREPAHEPRRLGGGANGCLHGSNGSHGCNGRSGCHGRECNGRNGRDVVYDLFAWTDHHGAEDSCGHYTAQARHSNGNFYKFDDARVSKVSPSARHPGPCQTQHP
jgi:ubiquitin C-terminal hydrolase